MLWKFYILSLVQIVWHVTAMLIAIDTLKQVLHQVHSYIQNETQVGINHGDIT